MAATCDTRERSSTGGSSADAAPVVHTPRKSGGWNPGFIDTVLGLIDSFYGEVVQNITPWVPPAPKIKRPAELSADDGSIEGHGGAGIAPPATWRPSSPQGS